ncbi:DUF155-domain-containing protein, partial [Thelephora ganbajun]
PLLARKPSASGLKSSPGAVKNQRTSKTSQKLVVLPSAPQTKPLPEEDDPHGYETDAGIVKERKNEGERMSKEQRKKAGFKRLTAYCVAESFNMKLLASFLRREHNVVPRMFDDAFYAMYHLPLLPGYSLHTNLRSSAFATSSDETDPLYQLSEAEELGYQGTYFTSNSVEQRRLDGYMTGGGSPDHTPLISVSYEDAPLIQQPREDHDNNCPPPKASQSSNVTRKKKRRTSKAEPPVDYSSVAEAVFFSYGVTVFFGFTENQEIGILEDVKRAGVMKRKMTEDDWEVEECHFVYDPLIAYPRIYNDFFTFKTHSHLLKVAVSHALAQSTLLSYYETLSARILSNPEIRSIPKRMATEGGLKLRRMQALKMTGKLFKLRRDVNLVSNVLDVPELFWSEASLKGLYDAVREYMEIGPRVHVLNEKLAVVSDLLDAIHDHLNNNAMERITWVIIWLIVVACLVEFGEVVARLVLHATTKS